MLLQYIFLIPASCWGP